MIELYKLREMATRDEGITIGLGRGRVEGQEKIAINRLKSGMLIEQIEKLTELNLLILQWLAREQKEAFPNDGK